MRSGPIAIDFARVLLVSLVSKTPFGSSAFAMMYQVPVAVPTGIVTLAEPWLFPPEGIAPVVRDPTSVSPPTTASDERQEAVGGSATSLLPAAFAVVSVTVIERPAPDFAGAPTTETLRSAPIT